MQSNESGSLVIKPCTQAEVDFYEAAKSHEHFQAQMPTYMGTLTLQKGGGATAAEGVVNGNASSHTTHPIPQSSTSLIQNLSAMLKASPLSSLFPSGQASTVPVTTSISSKRASWTPSGGKKLETGLAVVLENVAAGFTHPNIMDVKLGARLWADDAPASKRRKLDDVSKETTSGTLGFRIAGMKMWIPPDDRVVQDAPSHATASSSQDQPHVEVQDEYKLYNKNYGRALSADTVKDGFIEYLGGTSQSTTNDSGTKSARFKRRRSQLIAKRLIRELESVQFVLEDEESRMYSASILMVYEGDEQALETALETETHGVELSEEEANAEAVDVQRMVNGVRDEGTIPDEVEEDSDDEDPSTKVHDVRLIDFAHAAFTPGQGPDENALRGVREVIRILKEVVAQNLG